MSKYFFLLLPFLLSACSYSSFYVANDRMVYPPKDPNAVVVSAQQSVKQSHKVLGRVATITWSDGEYARKKLQREAAKIGANMVIDLRIERGFWRTSASGLAILTYQNE